jgi:uncharacterized membrane protein (DUF373 family)
MRLQSVFQKLLKSVYSDKDFLEVMEEFSGVIARILSLAMVVVIIVAVWDLLIVLSKDLWYDVSAEGFFKTNLVEIFGIFLSVLIAIEILENITAYLRRHNIQLELVVATSLTAVARKIIILDMAKITGSQLLGLSIAILALSISYWIVRDPQGNDHH